jgi:hypothetical protein
LRIAAAHRTVLEQSQAQARDLSFDSKSYAESRRLDRPVAGLGLRSPPPLQLLNPLLKALHHEREPLVTEPMGVAEARQSGHSALTLIASELETMPHDIDDGAKENDNNPDSNFHRAKPENQLGHSFLANP